MSNGALEDRANGLLGELVEQYTALVKKCVLKRWDAMPVDLYEPEPFEVLGALLARQGTLAMQLANAPSIWNGHIAPLVLRCMVDAHITLAWILKDKQSRARQYILYGLGQEKLYLEHLKALMAGGSSCEIGKIIQARESWLNSQRRDFLTEVNVGSWSGMNTRDMAKEAGCEILYNSAYLPFSGSVHSMWQHTCLYNLEVCENPLHKYHRVPLASSHVPSEIDYVFRSAKYLSRSCEAVDQAFGLDVGLPVLETWFLESLERMAIQIASEFPDTPNI